MDRVLLIIFGIISVILFSWSLHRSIITKIGLRNISRRWTNTFLIVIGSMVGTALISGSLVMSDSMDKTFENYVQRQAGEIDLIINFTPQKDLASPFAVIAKNDAKDISNLLKSTKIDGILAGLQFTVTPVKMDLQDEAIMNTYNVDLHVVNIEKLNLFGSNPQKIKSLKNDEIALSKSIANTLNAQIGDRIFIPITQNILLTKRVSAIYDQGGLFGGRTMVISPQALPEQFKTNTLTYNEIIISATGGAVPVNYDGTIFTEQVKDLLQNYKNENFYLKFNESKQSALDGFGLKLFVQSFLVLSIFGSFTGILLIINLYQMLANERQTEMGIMRAIGFTRLALMKVFVIEGYIYSILSSFLGSFIGVGLGYILLIPLSNLFNTIFSFSDHQGFDILFDFKISTLIISFVAGAIITIITVFFASWQTSKLNIVVAIRHLNEFKFPKVTIKWVFMNLLILIFFIGSTSAMISSFFIRNYLITLRNSESASNYFTKLTKTEFNSLLNTLQGFLLYMGVIGTVIFAGFLLTRIYFVIKHKNITPLVVNIVTIFNILFTSFTFKFSVISKAIGSDKGYILVFISGLILVVSFSALISYQLNIISKLVNYLLKPFYKISLIAKIAIRYPSENKLRTGLSLVMFSLIIYILVFVMVMLTINQDTSTRSIKKAFGGFDALVIPHPLSDTPDLVLTLQEDPLIKEIATLTNVSITLPDFQYKDLAISNNLEQRSRKQTDFNPEDNFQTVLNVLPPEYINNMEITLAERSPQFINDKEAWQAVIDDPQNIILGPLYVSKVLGERPELKVGDFIQIADFYGGNIYTKKIVGKVSNDQGGGRIFSDLLASSKILTNFSDKYLQKNSGNVLLLKKKNTVLNNDFGKGIKTLLIKKNILTIVLVEEINGLITSIINGFGLMFKGFLSFNLIVGISGLAIIMVRSVNERRQQIGMLRSLGWQREMILASFIFEVTIITFLSIIIGVSMGLVSVNNIIKSFNTTDFVLNLVVPWQQIIILSIIIYFVALIFSALPTIRAARLSPVEATNYPE